MRVEKASREFDRETAGLSEHERAWMAAELMAQRVGEIYQTEMANGQRFHVFGGWDEMGNRAISEIRESQPGCPPSDLFVAARDAFRRLDDDFTRKMLDLKKKIHARGGRPLFETALQKGRGEIRRMTGMEAKDFPPLFNDTFWLVLAKRASKTEAALSAAINSAIRKALLSGDATSVGILSGIGASPNGACIDSTDEYESVFDFFLCKRNPWMAMTKESVSLKEAEVESMFRRAIALGERPSKNSLRTALEQGRTGLLVWLAQQEETKATTLSSLTGSEIEREKEIRSTDENETVGQSFLSKIESIELEEAVRSNRTPLPVKSGKKRRI